jgi:uncharacterized protein
MHHSHMRVIFPTLILCGIFFSVPGHAASFNCARARSADERVVCASRALSELDVEMVVRFETLTGLVGMGTRGDMGDAQRDFLKARGRCGANNACLTALYQARIATLKNEYQSLKSRGPF